MKLEGRIAIVTGGATGIGVAITKALLEKGCIVVVASSNSENGKKILEELGTEKVHFIRTDLTIEDDIKNLVKNTIEKFGAIHILVNNSGIGLSTPINSEFFTLEIMRKVYTLNVFGPLLLVKYLMPYMSTQPVLNDKGERGVIINISTMLSIDGVKRTIIYSSSKAALNGTTLPLARELGKYGIRTVTIAPGFFRTPLTSPTKDFVINHILGGTPLGRLGDTPSIGDMVVGLAENTFITGCVIRADGGVRPGM